jgi:hypothetical protein
VASPRNEPKKFVLHLPSCVAAGLEIASR